MPLGRVDISEMAPTGSDSAADRLYRRSNLTRSQLLLWLGGQLDIQAPLYNMIHATRLDGAVDELAFAQAFADLVGATECLRSAVDSQDGVPRVRVADTPPIAHEWLDLSAATQPEHRVEQWLEQARKQPLDLERSLYRSVLIRTGPQTHI